MYNMYYILQCVIKKWYCNLNFIFCNSCFADRRSKIFFWLLLKLENCFFVEKSLKHLCFFQMTIWCRDLVTSTVNSLILSLTIFTNFPCRCTSTVADGVCNILEKSQVYSYPSRVILSLVYSPIIVTKAI